MTTIAVKADDGHTLRADDDGAGTTILVVPPGGGDASLWRGVTSRLVDRFRVVLLQRRIYEPGAVVELPHSVAREAADIVAVAETVSPPVIGVGHSSGAVALLEAALRRPELFRQLVLYEPPLPTTSLVGGAHTQAARRALDSGDPSAAMRIHMRDIVGMPAELVAQMWADPDGVRLMSCYAAGQVADNEAIDGLGVGVERYRALQLPVTLIDGDQSSPHLRHRLAELAESLPNVNARRTLVGQGHIAHLTAAAELAEVIADTVTA